jgi:hypothetical protein
MGRVLWLAVRATTDGAKAKFLDRRPARVSACLSDLGVVSVAVLIVASSCGEGAQWSRGKSRTKVWPSDKRLILLGTSTAT